MRAEIACAIALVATISTACQKEAPAPTAPPAAPAAPPPPPPPAPPPPPLPPPPAAPPADAAKASDTAGAGAAATAPAAANKALLDPSALSAQAPAKFKVKFTTSKGDFVVEVNRAWAPLGADRFYNLVKNGYFDDVRFFRAIAGFMVQFGIHGDPAVSAVWRNARIQDDPAKESNKRGTITFATSGPNSRTNQVFINFKDNVMLDGMGFAPFGRVVSGMSVVDSINTEYGEGAPSGRGPSQGRLQAEGNAYLARDFPKLDYVKQAKLAR